MNGVTYVSRAVISRFVFRLHERLAQILSIFVGRTVPLARIERTELHQIAEVFVFESSLNDRPDEYDRIAIGLLWPFHLIDAFFLFPSVTGTTLVFRIVVLRWRWVKVSICTERTFSLHFIVFLWTPLISQKWLGVNEPSNLGSSSFVCAKSGSSWVRFA